MDVKVLKPSTINLGDIRNLAVSDFEFVGSWSFDENEEPETISKIAKEALKKSLDIAEEYFEKCFELSGKNEYLDARVRIQKRKKELQKLQE